MWMHEEAAVLLAKERIGEAICEAERARAFRFSQKPRRSVRARLGRALVRLGWWLMGRSVSEPRPPIEIGQLPS